MPNTLHLQWHASSTPEVNPIAKSISPTGTGLWRSGTKRLRRRFGDRSRYLHPLAVSLIPIQPQSNSRRRSPTITDLRQRRHTIGLPLAKNSFWPNIHPWLATCKPRLAARTKVATSLVTLVQQSKQSAHLGTHACGDIRLRGRSGHLYCLGRNQPKSKNRRRSTSGLCPPNQPSSKFQHFVTPSNPRGR